MTSSQPIDVAPSLGRPFAGAFRRQNSDPPSSFQHAIYANSHRSPSMSGKHSREGVPLSWGTGSAGNFLQDDVMMDAGSSFPPQFAQSPSFHSSSYLPKMEANFLNNLRCCDGTFKDLHELQQHYEETHAQTPMNSLYKTSIPETGHLGRNKSQAPAHGMNSMFPSSRSDRSRLTQSWHGPPPTGEFWLERSPNQQPQVHQFHGHRFSDASVPDIDALADLELDEVPTSAGHSDSRMAINPQVNGTVAPLNTSHGPPPLDTELAKMMERQGNLFTPTSARSVQHHPEGRMKFSNAVSNLGSANSVYSTDSESVLTPPEASLSAQYPYLNNQQGLTPDILQYLDQFQHPLHEGSMDMCVNEPAKSLFNNSAAPGIPNGNSVSHTIISDPEEAARQLQSHHLAANIGAITGEEERPFTCPVIGCEKAYKNANGLRYHEKHGHANQRLKQNSDGSFSIIDPDTALPYPGTQGMEKEKPYRCDACGKRYKNLNGLKYHKNHAPPCNREAKSGEVANGSGMPDEENIEMAF